MQVDNISFLRQIYIYLYNVYNFTSLLNGGVVKIMQKGGK